MGVSEKLESDYPSQQSVFWHFMGTDIVESAGKGTSSVDMFRQTTMLNDIIESCPTFERAIWAKDIGDGAIVAFPESVEDPIDLAIQLQLALREKPEVDFYTRIGLHSEPVLVTTGINGRPDVRGWGATGVVRVMSFGDGNHILASGIVVSMLLNLDRKRYSKIVHRIGRRLDKNGVEFLLYNIYSDEFGNPKDPTAPEVYPCDYLSYYESETPMSAFEDIGLPYTELWSSDGGLDHFSVDCHMVSERFEPSGLLTDKIRRLRDWLALDRRVNNRTIARLHHHRERDGTLHLYFQETKYIPSLINSYLDVKFREWDKPLRDILAPNPLPSLDSPENLCPNSVGISCIIETADVTPKIFLQRRTSEVAINPNMLGPSASGGLDFKSSCPEPGERRAPSPFRGMVLEIMDELGMMPEEIGPLKIVAVCRELARGGKPELFFVGRTLLTFDDVKTRWEENPLSRWETEFLLPVEVKDRQRLIDLITTEQNVSLPLRANLHYYLIWTDRRTEK